eukprot:14597512-Alexandrium_andersonii.AAC.1
MRTRRLSGSSHGPPSVLRHGPAVGPSKYLRHRARAPARGCALRSGGLLRSGLQAWFPDRVAAEVLLARGGQ